MGIETEALVLLVRSWELLADSIFVIEGSHVVDP